MKALKEFGLGIVWVILSPFLLLGIALVAIFGIPVFFVELILMIIHFFQGKKLFPPFPEDEKAYAILKNAALEEEETPEEPQPPQPQTVIINQNYYPNPNAYGQPQGYPQQQGYSQQQGYPQQPPYQQMQQPPYPQQQGYIPQHAAGQPYPQQQPQIPPQQTPPEIPVVNVQEETPKEPPLLSFPPSDEGDEE